MAHDALKGQGRHGTKYAAAKKRVRWRKGPVKDLKSQLASAKEDLASISP